ncbi:MAG: hypothetical protein DRI86_02505 [Bacteroidetes bacterium]|nr:MAG: hypothetical protein DRI86_02505 [Bacteroidota bacterium]
MSNAQYNPSLLLEMMDGNQNEVNELAHMLFDLAPQMLAEIEFCIDEKKWEMAGDVSHKLKSSLKLWKMNNLVPYALYIEKNGRNNTNYDEIIKNFEALKIGLNKVLILMKKEY